MELSEMSNEFDVMYNNITSNQAPGLDEYEKSVFLTQGQYDILRSYFDPRSNKVQEGYDGSQKRQIDFSAITVTKSYNRVLLAEPVPMTDLGGATTIASHFSSPVFDTRAESKGVSMPNDIMMMLNERLEVTRGNKTVLLTVIPVQFTEYDRLMSKPYKRPNKFQAWRVFNYSSGATTSDLVVGPGDTIDKYTFRYVRRPKPIVLANLDGLTIEGYGEPTKCELDPILHHEILKRAVELAKAAYQGDLQSQVAMGQASQTDIGIVQQR